MHIPQFKEIENYEVNLEDVSEMTQTVSPHEITIPIKIPDYQTEYFQDTTLFYSWNKINNIKRDFCYYYSKCSYNFKALNKLNKSSATVQKVIKKIKKYHSIPLFNKPPKIKKEKIVKPRKYKRKSISEEIKEYIIKKLDTGTEPRKLAQLLYMKVKRINKIYKLRKNYFKPVKKKKHIEK